MAHLNSTPVSQAFCCRECGADVALQPSPAGEMYYTCQNVRCGKCVHVDCPEALGIKCDAPTTPTSPAARKAAYQLSQGVRVIAHAGGYLVPSGTRAGVVHFVDVQGVCSCEAGQHGRACWHASAVRQVACGKAAA